MHSLAIAITWTHCNTEKHFFLYLGDRAQTFKKKMESAKMLQTYYRLPSLKAGNAGLGCNRSKSQAPRRGRKIRPNMEDYRQRCAIMYMCFDPSAHDVYGLGDSRMYGFYCGHLLGIWWNIDDDICRHLGRGLVELVIYGDILVVIW